ncbi:Component of the holoenzyme form of RNA polymerase transcription factor TFIIH [Perkinsela sp. CCAP 1560/4]|nr:Component of the holoenzyme form of RNA polymerase transcription factor TFIIH [Perkinsela sp. CCAP 1560/4]|eukprot:KNH07290.1 Component of the holoenzyme form of RNA polymerase transcription factor TFIIH [Perkinsela sp. CCAP 1560/4]
MWMSYAEDSGCPLVHIVHTSPGPQRPFLRTVHAELPAFDDRPACEAIRQGWSSLVGVSTLTFIRSIAEPMSLQTWMHTYSITPYSLLGGVSTGCTAPNAILLGLLLTAWNAACSYLPRVFPFSAQVEILYVSRCVEFVISQWTAGADVGPRKVPPKVDSITALRRLQPRISLEEIDSLVSCIDDAFQHFLSSTCILRVLKFVFLTYQRYGKFLLVHRSLPLPQEAYLLESTAPPEVNRKIAEKFGISIQPSAQTDMSTASHTCVIRVPADMRIEVKSYIIDELSFSMTEQYVFSEESHESHIPIRLRQSLDVRPYQRASWERFAPQGRFATSGLIILPCGAGKTLVGIGAICIVGRPAIVVCPSAVSVEQWRAQFIEYTQTAENILIDKLIYRCTSKSRDVFHESTCVVITTYSMLTAHRSDDRKSSRDPLAWVSARQWGLVVFDEVHSLPANTFQKCIKRIPSKCVLGLTATLLREDNKVKSLTTLVGPKLFEATWWDLFQGNFIARVVCRYITCSTHDAFLREYYRPETPMALRLALAASNPTKVCECVRLTRHHLQKGDKVMVFSDSLHALRITQGYLQCPMIIGTTPHEERMRILFEFQYSQSCGVICVSRVGDTSINLPAATVLIQISSQGGSRRQEMQRIGRLLRPKPDGGVVSFYSLVSCTTHEEQFACKRRDYLIQQGYSCELRSCDSLLEGSTGHQLPFATEKEILDTLARLVSKWRIISLEDFLEKKHLLEDAYPYADRQGSEGIEEDHWLKSSSETINLRHGSLKELSVDPNFIFSEYQVASDEVR